MNGLYKLKINKNGFTLAEVLITLVIIGVVAALTISPLVNTYVESSTVAKVKKGLSILGQAKKLAEVQNGSIEGWDIIAGNNTSLTASQFWNYLKPHISVAKDCGSSQACYQSNGVHQLNGSLHVQNYNTSSVYYKFALADGGIMWFRTGLTGTCSSTEGSFNNVCATFWYDVNGDKAPNTFGRDIFNYVMTVDGVYPVTDESCNGSGTGLGCSGYIIRHNNMKYLH